MKFLIVYAHPSENSLNYAIKEVFLEGLNAGRHSYKVIDLYKDNFNPLLSEDELKEKKVSSDVSQYQKMITEADHLVFIFPIWWYRAPAILEGWFDRVFSANFAFKYVQLPIIKAYRPIGLLKGKKATIISTYGGPKIFYWLFVRFAPFKRLSKGVLAYCGINCVYHYPLYSAAFNNPVSKEKFLNFIRGVGKKIN